MRYVRSIPSQAKNKYQKHNHDHLCLSALDLTFFFLFLSRF
jgi:hypothetical protein